MKCPINYDWSYMETVNYSMQQNNIPIIRKLILTNTSEEILQEISVEIICEPEFAYTWKQTVDSIPPGQSVDLGSISMSLSSSLLAQLSERVNGYLTLNLYHNEKLLSEERRSIAVLSFDEWSGSVVLPELTAAFVLPNHPQITNIVREASQLLEKWSQSSAFDAYQRKDPNRVRLQAAAIYETISRKGIVYNVAPPSFELIGQRVRLPESVLNYRMGNCLDLSLLYAACLEAVGLHPLIVFTRGHAFTAVWLEEETFAEIVQDDLSLLTKRLSNGINELEVIEATAMAGSSPASFDTAARLGSTHLQKPEEFESFIDIKRARFSGIRPLPIRTASESGWIIEKEDFVNRNEAEAPLMHEYLSKPQELENSVGSTRQQQWERKLLDLTLRNTLLNFRLSKSSISVMCVQLGDLEDALAEREEFQLLARPEEWKDHITDISMYQQSLESNTARLLQQEFTTKRLRSELPPAELDKRLVHLYRSARTALEENGANALYLALGLLKWYETSTSQMPRYAPIVLIPVELIRRTSRQGYVVRARDEEPLMNITLLEMIKQDFGITITGLDPLPRDEKGVALKHVFHTLRHALLQVSRWDVIEKAHLGLFSFGQFVMWNDLRTRSAELSQNPIVSSLMEGKLQGLIMSEQSKKLDDIHPTELMMPLSADSSQLEAVQAAALGESFVLHGPPGTGKSQTITNMIANALADGKKVLFVAEKIAALSVVERRLEELGIGQFCLQLHSNKSTKRAVLDQLEAALEAASKQRPNGWQNEAHNLHALRSELNNYVDALHEQRASGYTLHDAICGYEQVESLVEPVRFTNDSYLTLTADRISEWRVIVAQLQVAARKVAPIVNHPLSEVTQTEYTPQLKSEAEEALQGYLAVVEQFRNDLQAFIDWNKLIPSSIIGSRQTELLIALNELMLQAPKISEAWLLAQSVHHSIEMVRATAVQGRVRDSAKTAAMEWFLPTALQFSAQELLSEWTKSELKWFASKWFAQKRMKNLLKTMMKPGQQITTMQVTHLLQLLIQWQVEERKLIEFETKVKPLLGELWNEQGDWQAMEDACAWLEQLQRLLMQWHTDVVQVEALRQSLASKLLHVNENEELQKMFKQLKQSHSQLEEKEKQLTKLLKVDFSLLEADKQEVDWSSLRLEKAKQWLLSLDALRDWCTWRRIREQALQAELSTLIEQFEGATWESNELISAFERGLFMALINGVLGEDERLKSFSGHLFEETIARFKKADQRFAEMTKQEIVSRLSARVPNMSHEAAQSSEAGILQRAIRNGGRGVSIRRLFEMIPNLLARLTPCMLMSPISVAQYLEPSYAKFDLVIFDEASQVPTAQAVGALARGNQAVIVGDPKQLPPTSFFSRAGSETENEEAMIQDMESILDDCLAISMPERHLLWHYRSRHESLIAFSNSHYYGNKLLTFPSPNEPVSNVIYHQIDGYYDRGHTKVNRAEGEAVIAEICRRLKDEELRNYSIGVVTFSSVQQTLIEDMLDEAIHQQPELELLIQELPEHIFVKNLENVQGDERDVILFSVGYGPDSTGKVTLNFGPLNRKGGWRRLNVAISRARLEMHVFSTLRSSHLQLGRISSEGVIGLKQFLEYAEKGKQALPVHAAGAVIPLHSALHRSIADELKQYGLESELNVGTSGYRIDIGVIDKDDPQQYVLGIVLDGPMYRAAHSARDREILREQVLRELGWNIMNVWSPDWWENRQAVVHSILQEIERTRTEIKQTEEGESEILSDELLELKELDKVKLKKVAIKLDKVDSALRNRVYTAEPKPNDLLESKQVTEKVRSGPQRYKACELPMLALGADQFLSAQSTPVIIAQIQEVISEEGPISRALLGRRLLNCWGITRMGAKLEQRYSNLLDRLNPIQTVGEEGNIFYWPSEFDPVQMTSYRVAQLDNERRNAEDLPPEEIAAAVKDILTSQISLPKDELIKQTAKQLGYGRVGAALDKAIRYGIEIALQNGSVEDQGGRLVIV